MTITMTDIFAGAGGSTTGACQVPGVEVSLAANHWPLAVQVHAENHPHTNHACVDLHMEDPRNFPRTDILWASPECTKWSIANRKAKALSVELGGDPTLFGDVPDGLISEGEDEITRSRLLMFDVLRFVEYHRYRAVLVENVVDVATQAKYAVAWAAWRRGLRRLGYEYQVVSLNSMHAQAAGDPAPQSRDRLYVVAWPHGCTAPDIDRVMRPAAWCPRCDTSTAARQAFKPGRTVGRYHAQYVYVCPDCGAIVEPGWRPALTIIDWSIPAERIADRKRPLSAKTLARIREGLRRYGTAEPLMVRHNSTRAGDNPGHLCTPVTEPLRTLTASNVHTLLVPYYSASETAKPVSHPIGTLTCTDRYALATAQPQITDADVMDCRLRMLAPHEVAAGMAFPTDYHWEGTKRERVRLAGNAVTPPAARDLLTAVTESMEVAA